MKLPLKVIAVAGGMLALSGCGRAPELRFEPRAEFQKLPAPVQKKLTESLVKLCGTPQQPKVPTLPEAKVEHLLAGQRVYMTRCTQCHGDAGDGQGPAAHWLYPRPRDYRKGVFKFTSTKYGNHPLREDLVNTVRRGIVGTSMPAFNLLDDKEVNAVVDYVLFLTQRGEIELRFCSEFADLPLEELTDEAIQEAVGLVIERWKDAPNQLVKVASEQPVFTAEHVLRGKQAFLTKGCSKCHGEDGRGQTKENVGTDDWGHATKAADLTSGMLHGGSQPMDVYRRVYGGINGTPMPAFATLEAENKDLFWDLVAYVLYVSNERRRGRIPEAGLVTPHPIVAQPVAAATSH